MGPYPATLGLNGLGASVLSAPAAVRCMFEHVEHVDHVEMSLPTTQLLEWYFEDMTFRDRPLLQLWAVLILGPPPVPIAYRSAVFCPQGTHQYICRSAYVRDGRFLVLDLPQRR